MFNMKLKGKGGDTGIRRPFGETMPVELLHQYVIVLWITQVVSDCSEVYNRSTSELLSKRR